MAHGADSLKSIFFALAANLAIAIAKFGAAIFTGSGAMLAEAIHSFADTGNQVLLLVGLRKARRPPSEEHPLGYGKAIYFWSFIVALILFSMGGLYSMYEGIHKLQHPEPLTSPLLAIGVLLFAVIAEGISLWGCMREINKERGSRSIRRWFKETRQSELLVVFGEDSAALAGLGIAIIAIGLTGITGNPVYDACGSIAIGLLLVFVAFRVGVEIKDLLIGQGVEQAVRERMLTFLRNRSEIKQVFNLLTLQMGADVMVAIKAEMTETKSAEKLIQDINRCERDFRNEFTETIWLFFEPDNQD